jgi:hypothetical protein
LHCGPGRYSSHFRAIEVSQSETVSFWDALIIRAAMESGSARILSEDLHDGRTFGNARAANRLPSTSVTLARETPTWRARAARLSTSPDARRRRRSEAWLRAVAGAVSGEAPRWACFIRAWSSLNTTTLGLDRELFGRRTWAAKDSPQQSHSGTRREGIHASSALKIVILSRIVRDRRR